ncbi:MAG TPA: HDOD domain-containing protein [Thermosulfurimonas dismutans]|uniref:HDOD domain-containing protein n=1 Tax=Thermosulfurimonas dismutans TaxID=999894 RepID=A0A7C3CQ43_9BACT|nr:HDOD domain-containing protein [Thermosulfurimonas dismutans]
MPLKFLVILLLVGIVLYFFYRRFATGVTVSTKSTENRSETLNYSSLPGQESGTGLASPPEIVSYDLGRYSWSAAPVQAEAEKILRDFLKDVPPPRTISPKLEELLSKPESNVREIARMVSLDPLLTAQILKVANSAYFRPSGAPRVNSIHRAIILLGYNYLRVLLLEYFFRRTLEKCTSLPSEEFSKIWKHSIEVSAILGSIALARRYDVGLYTTAGILHDIGKFFLPLFPSSQEFSFSLGEEDLPPLKEEEIRYGFGHTLLGKLVVKTWNLPPEIEAAVGYHHPVSRLELLDLPPESRKIAAWVTLADHLAHLYGRFGGGYVYEVPGWIYPLLGLKSPEGLITREFLWSLKRASSLAEAL